MKKNLLCTLAVIASVLTAGPLAVTPTVSYAQAISPTATIVSQLRADQVAMQAPSTGDDATSCAPDPRAPFDGMHEYTCAYEAFLALHIDLADPAKAKAFVQMWNPKNFINSDQLKTEDGTFRLIRDMRDSLRNRVFPDHDLFDYVNTPSEHSDQNKQVVAPVMQGGIGIMVKLNNAWQIEQSVWDSRPDPKAPFQSLDEFKAFQTKMSDAMIIGPGHELMVDAPVQDSPSWGLLHDNDMIIAVNGKSLNGMTLTQATGLLRGEVGTVVNITVQRTNSHGATVQFNLSLVRAQFDEHAVIVHDINGIRHIIVTDFENEHLLKDFHDALVGAKGMKGIDVDVRGNPGGRLAYVEAMLEMMVSRGEILKQQQRNEGQSTLNQREILLNPEFLVDTVTQVGGDPADASGHAYQRVDYTDDYGQAVDQNGDNYVITHPLKTVIDDSMPVTVDINGQSYSASEIFAGALQATHRATIVGEPSPGKGVVMTQVPLPDGGMLDVTSGRYFPGGIDTENVGIIPDIEVHPAADFGKTDAIRDAASAEIEKEAAHLTALKAEEQKRIKINVDNFNKQLDQRDNLDHDTSGGDSGL